MKPYYDDGRGITIYHGDCREVLPSVSGVGLVVADPPYNGVQDEDWDNQWATDSEFFVWLDGALTQINAATNNNGTLYVFCSPRLAAQTEMRISELFCVIASCVWDKGELRKGTAGTGIDVGALRTYWTSGGERCVVAEKRPLRYEQADDAARDASGYWSSCEDAKRSIFGDYLRAEFARAGVSAREIAALFPSRTGGMTGCVSNWFLGYNCPTAEQYEKMREHLGQREYLRKEYEDLRKDYEDLRRPFTLTERHQWGDIWRFSVPRNGRLHPAQKPIGLISQIVDVSSRSDDLILDPFMGSGTTLRAAKDLGRKAIGIEIEERYCAIAAERLSQEVLPL